ncbi:MAG: Rieske (2Fe-2S) protein [Rubrobacteraceae bacterium]
MEERVSRRKFIRLGAAIGVSAAGASVVAACGGGSGGGAGSGGASTTASSGGGAATTGSTDTVSSGGQAIARASEVPANSAKKFTNSGQPAVLVHLQGGDFVAYSAVCTHQQCTVAYQEGQLACPCHGSIFDPSNGGQVVTGPAPRPLPEIPIKVQGGEITRA